jgi:hypothetical protein
MVNLEGLEVNSVRRNLSSYVARWEDFEGSYGGVRVGRGLGGYGVGVEVGFGEDAESGGEGVGFGAVGF